jgi:hypothetical protein
MDIASNLDLPIKLRRNGNAKQSHGVGEWQVLNTQQFL